MNKLSLGCHFRNLANKGDLFPLEDDARATIATISAVRDRFCSSQTGPRIRATTSRSTARCLVPVGRTTRGRATIDVLGLDRKDHVARLPLLSTLRESWAAVNAYHRDTTPAAIDYVARVRGIIERSMRSDAPFSAMAMASFEGSPLPG